MWTFRNLTTLLHLLVLLVLGNSASGQLVNKGLVQCNSIAIGIAGLVLFQCFHLHRGLGSLPIDPTQGLLSQVAHLGVAVLGQSLQGRVG